MRQDRTFGVRRAEYDWGYILYGTKAALISAGLVQESWLQDGTARDKRGRVARSKELTVNGRRVKTTMTNPKRQIFTVSTSFTEAEVEERIKAENAACLEAEKAAPAKAEAPVKREEYVAQLRLYFNLAMQMVTNCAAGSRGWKLPGSDYQKFIELGARGDAIISNVRPLPMNAPVLRLVNA